MVYNKINKKISKIIFCWLLLLLIIVSAAGCSMPKSSSPGNTIRNFFNSYNKLDVDGMLDCIEPTTAKGVKALFNIADGVLGGILGVKISVKDVLDVLPLFASFMDGYGDIKMPRINIISMSTATDGNYSDVSVKLNVVSDGQTESFSGVFEMKLIDRKWYIVNIREY